MGMGFDASKARAILPTVDYDVSRAIDKLVLSGDSSSSSSTSNGGGRMLGNNDHHNARDSGDSGAKDGEEGEDVLEIVVPEG